MRITRFVISSSIVIACFAGNARAQTTANQPAKSPQTISSQVTPVITGHVSAEGKPLAGAQITLWHGYSEPTPATTFASGKTDSNGNYQLNNVPPGNYFMSATAAGFVTGRENNLIENFPRVAVVGTSAISPINFEFVREGVISGTVSDADGKPVAKVPIIIVPDPLPFGDPHYTRDLRTDERGAFQITGIPGGRYRIAAGYEPVTFATMYGLPGYARVYYGGSVDQASARVIQIVPGANVANVDINVGRAAKTFSVRATIVDSQSGKPVPDIGYRLSAFSNGKRIGGAARQVKSNERGEIVIENVPAGEYSIVVPGASGTWPVGTVPAAPDIFGESQHFQVTDKDVDQIEVRVVKAARVSGTVAIEGAAGSDLLARLPQIQLIAMVEPRPGDANPMMLTNIKPDGSFLFTGLKPGKLKFNFWMRTEAALPLRLTRVERNGLRLDQPPELEPGTELTGLRVVLGYVNSGIHGIVKLDDGPLPVGAVGLATISQNGAYVDSAELDSHGEFIVPHLSAGEYTLTLFARIGSQPEWRTQQTIKVPDNKVIDFTVKLSSRSN